MTKESKLKPKGRYTGDNKYIYFGTSKVLRGNHKYFKSLEFCSITYKYFFYGRK